MISVALALLLLVGINQVFKTTSTTVGTSYATLEGIRTQLALDNVLTPDFNKAVDNTEQPFILIHSESFTQYQDAADYNADKDTLTNPTGAVATTDLDGDGNEGQAAVRGEVASPADAAGRVHRTDRIAFFARDADNPFRRQTGDYNATTTTFVTDESSAEAMIWYGFLRLPANGSNLDPRAFPTGNYFTPAQASATAQQNQNNFYAKDWSLGRQVILLESNPIGDHIDKDVNNILGPANAPKVPPLSAESPAYSTSPSVAPLNSPAATPWTIISSRYDVAKTTIADFRKTMAVIDATEPEPPLAPTALCRTTWHVSDPARTTPVTATHGNLDYQFNGKPWADPAGDRTAELATTTPFLNRGCSQFIVEWAGDYLTQDNNPTLPSGAVNPNYGEITGIGPDGVLDFIPTSDSNGRKMSSTRWYGYPRNVNTSDDSATLPMIRGIPTTSAPTPIDLIDVVPLRDLIEAALNRNSNMTIDPDYLYADPITHGRTFAGKNYPGKKCPERDVPTICNNYADTAGNGLPPNSSTGLINTTTGKPVYVAAWGPAALTDPYTSSTPTAGTYPGPWLIRVLLTVRDPNGRLPNGQTLEHVYSFKK